MKVKELREYLKSFDQDAEVFVANDEELNEIMTEFEVAVLENEENLEVVIYGLSGTEKEYNWEEV
jgi:ribonucleotide monophosphatase NagD (HAD superfamily)